MVTRQEVLPLPESLLPKSIACVFMLKYVSGSPYVLLAERLQGSKERRFTFPGGVVEVGESPIQCALRELREETGFIVDEDDLITAHMVPLTITTKGELLKAYSFFAFWDESTNESSPINLEPDKHGEWQWVPIKEAAFLSMSGELPSVLFQGIWLEVLEEISSLQS